MGIDLKTKEDENESLKAEIEALKHKLDNSPPQNATTPQKTLNVTASTKTPSHNKLNTGSVAGIKQSSTDLAGSAQTSRSSSRNGPASSVGSSRGGGTNVKPKSSASNSSKNNRRGPGK